MHIQIDVEEFECFSYISEKNKSIRKRWEILFDKIKAN